MPFGEIAERDLFVGMGLNEASEFSHAGDVTVGVVWLAPFARPEACGFGLGNGSIEAKVLGFGGPRRTTGAAKDSGGDHGIDELAVIGLVTLAHGLAHDLFGKLIVGAHGAGHTAKLNPRRSVSCC